MTFPVSKRYQINYLDKFLAVYLLSLVLALPCFGEYLGGGAGYGLYRLNYLPDTGQLNTPVTRFDLDATHWRRTQTGPISRGVALLWEQGSGVSASDLHLPLYNWHRDHGLWFARSHKEVENITTLSSQSAYLANSGSPIDLGTGSEITSIWSMTRYRLFWRSDASRHGIANRAGVYWQTQTSPIEAEITGITPEIFDGKNVGYGIYVAKHQDQKGWNYQWSLHLGQHVTELSENTTDSGDFSESERRQLQFEGQFTWDYRYYLSPYWYLVPEIKWQLQLLVPSKSTAQNVKLKTVYFSEVHTSLALRRYF